MKLIKCYVSSFGKLSDFTYDFSQGLNTIKEDNGWGKSTLATFIKAMFYGLNGSKRSVAENERIKFRPWNSTQKFGGYIEFEWGENEYKIERYFGLKESEDTLRLFDLKTGKEFANTENLGKRIFEIDEEGFFSTTYFSQKDFEIKSNSSLTAKFNSVCDIQDTDVFDKAVEKLENKSKSYKYRGDKGLIPDLKREIAELDYELEKASKSTQALTAVKQEVAEIESAVKDLNNKIELKTKEISDASKAQIDKVKKQHYEQLLSQKHKVQSEIERVNSILNNNNVSKEDIDKCLSYNQDLLSIKANQEILRADIEKLNEGKKNEAEKVKPNNSKNLLLLSTILTLVAFGSYFIDVLVGIILTTLSLVFDIVFIFSFKNKQPKNTLSDQLDAIIKEKQEKLGECINLDNKISSVLDSFILRFNVKIVNDRVSALNQILDANNEKERIEKELVNINERLLEYKDITFEKVDLSDKNIAFITSELESLQDRYKKITNDLASKKSAIVYHENIANNIVDLESKKEELLQRLKDYSDEHKILTLTTDYLKKADENLKIKYRAPLQDSLNKYLDKIVVGGFNAQIDIDLNVSVQEKDGAKHTDYYSKGYQNLIEICKRFALTDVLFRKEKPFIILDDPFYNLDDQKIEKALELVKELSKDYQIIYFICHESRRG